VGAAVVSLRLARRLEFSSHVRLRWPPVPAHCVNQHGDLACEGGIRSSCSHLWWRLGL